MAVVVREAHANGLKVWPWGEYGFFMHYNATLDENDCGWILTHHPDWKIADKDGHTALLNEGMKVMHFSANPAHPAARAFLVELHLDIARRYPIDGINTDRFRYMNTAWGHDALLPGCLYKGPGNRPCPHPRRLAQVRHHQLRRRIRRTLARRIPRPPHLRSRQSTQHVPRQIPALRRMGPRRQPRLPRPHDLRQHRALPEGARKHQGHASRGHPRHRRYRRRPGRRNLRRPRRHHPRTRRRRHRHLGRPRLAQTPLLLRRTHHPPPPRKPRFHSSQTSVWHNKQPLDTRPGNGQYLLPAEAPGLAASPSTRCPASHRQGTTRNR
jgi:hypothetical protein